MDPDELSQPTSVHDPGATQLTAENSPPPPGVVTSVAVPQVPAVSTAWIDPAASEPTAVQVPGAVQLMALNAALAVALDSLAAPQVPLDSEA